MVLFGGVPVDALRTIHVAVLDVPADVLDVAGVGVTLMAFAGGACAVTDTPTIAEPDGDVASGAVEVADNTSGCGDDVGYPPLKVTHTVADWPGNSVMGCCMEQPLMLPMHPITAKLIVSGCDVPVEVLETV